MTRRWSSLSRSGPVSAPSPGPISTTESAGCRSKASTILSRTLRSWRKCWPNLLRGTCELDGKLDRLDQAAGVGPALAGDVERRAVVDGSAHERQAKCDVHPATEARILEHRQPLVVVHGEHAIRAAQAFRHEQRVRRDGPGRGDAGRYRLLDRGPDYVEIFGTEVPGFAAVRIQPGHKDARRLDPESVSQVAIEHLQCLQQQIF